MGTWQIVGKSWRLARKGLGILGLVTLIQAILGLVALPLAAEDELTGTELLLVLGLLLVNLFVFPLIQGGCLGFANARLSQENPPLPLASFGRGIRQLYRRLLGFEALYIGIFLVGMIIGVLLFATLAGVADLTQRTTIALGLLLAVPIGLGLYCVLLLGAMAPVAIAVERLGVFGAIKKGFAVGRQALGKLLLVVLALLLTLIPAFMIFVISAALGWQIASIVGQSLVIGLGSILFSAALIQVYRLRASA